MPIKILLRSTYRRLLSALDERDALLAQRDADANRIARLQEEIAGLRETLKKTREEFEAQQAHLDEVIERRVDERIAEMNISRRKFEQMLQDRVDLIELYAERLYALAVRFAQESVEEQQNRGLFILLVDRRNMDPKNFSDFHESQKEYLEHEEFIGIERLPHIFSPQAQRILDYMGRKEIRFSRDGEIVGYEERDGAVLIDLRGVVYKTRQMVEGVRTHKVYAKVERLMDGSARHNAALYASSLDEVLISIVVSEETNRVTIFKDGKFDRAYDPYENRVITREEYFASAAEGEPAAAPIASSRAASEETLPVPPESHTESSTSS